MDLGLKGRAAIVAAASKGFGKASAKHLAMEGCNLVICARGKDALERTAKEIHAEAGVRVVPVQADVGSKEDVQRVVETAGSSFGRVDILVTNSGGPPSGRFVDLADEDWLAAFNQLVLSVVRFCRLVIPHMQRQRWGRIVNITSLAVKQPLENLVLSNSIRTGVIGLAKTLAGEYAKDGILVNNVCPGTSETDRMIELIQARSKRENRPADELRTEYERSIPLRRLGRPEELGAVVAFLCSEKASFLTGVSVQVDGGAHRGIF